MAESSTTEPVSLSQAALKVIPQSVLKPHYERPQDRVSTQFLLLLLVHDKRCGGNVMLRRAV
jgi:hypothetical protein